MGEELYLQDAEDEKQEVFVGEDPPRLTKGIRVGLAISLLFWAALVIAIFMLK
jgi:hypothetical protein